MAQKKNSSQGEAQASQQIINARDLGLEGIDKEERVSPSCFAQYIRILRQNWRQGTVGCKDRSEVAFSGRKPWKQKGTGRARAGSRRSPLWRKGGVIFGPQPRVRTLYISQATRRAVLRTLLLDALESGKIMSLAYDVHETPSTVQAFQALQRAGVADKKIIFLTSLHDAHVHASFANIPTVKLALFDQPNAFSLADSAYWVYLQKDAESFKQMVQRWI